MQVVINSTCVFSIKESLQIVSVSERLFNY
jgi:hypothetical protein